jgi:AraC-like DNA-binding protein
VSSFLTASFPAEPLTRFPNFAHEDLAAVEDHLNHVIIPHRLTSSANVPHGSFRHSGVDFGAFSLCSVRYDFGGGRLRVACPSMDDDYRIQITVSGSGRVGNHTGEELFFGPTSFVIIHPNRAFVETFDSRCHHLLLTVRRRALETAYAEWTGHLPTARLRIEPSVVKVDGEGRPLVRYLAMLCGLLDANDRQHSAPELPRSVVRSLPQLLLRTLRHSHSDEFHRKPEAFDPAYVRRVEDYLLANAREDITMGELVAIAGCSARSVYHSFRKLRGVSPMRYLRDYRLAISREQLQDAQATGKSVTEIALACGFTHMSKYTAWYKARFGETPSATRNRRVSD